MIARQASTTLSYAAMFAAGIGFGSWLLAASPAGALIDSRQVLAGGNRIGDGATFYTSPGFADQFSVNFPGTGLGEVAVQLRMPAGVLSTLKVKLTTPFTPSSGAFILMVRKNGANTALTCQLTGSGTCNGTANVTFAANDRLSVRVSNNFVGPGTSAYSYTLLFD